MIFQNAPPLVLSQQPHAAGQVGAVDKTVARKFREVRVGPCFAQAILVTARHALVDGINAGVNAPFVRTDFSPLDFVTQAGISQVACVRSLDYHGAAGVMVLFSESPSRGQRPF